MIKLSDYFDDLTIQSRIMPGIVGIAPSLVIALINGFFIEGISETVLYSMVSISFYFFLSKICRERGKKYEKKMYSELGEMPTTIVMRYSDNHISNVTKRRYHKVLSSKVENITFPSVEKEENEQTDEMYASAMKWLRVYANKNRNDNMRVYQELKEYNYWRNLYGIKTPIIIYYSLITIILAIDQFNFLKIEIAKSTRLRFIEIAIALISVLIFSICLRKETVKEKAFDYAVTLSEVCDGF